MCLQHTLWTAAAMLVRMHSHCISCCYSWCTQSESHPCQLLVPKDILPMCFFDTSVHDLQFSEKYSRSLHLLVNWTTNHKTIQPTIQAWGKDHHCDSADTTSGIIRLDCVSLGSPVSTVTTALQGLLAAPAVKSWQSKCIQRI